MFAFFESSNFSPAGLRWILDGLLGLVVMIISWRLYVHLHALRSVDKTPVANSTQNSHPAKSHPQTSDRTYVRALLLENDGQMRQKKLVDETGWSKAKASLLLSEMETNEQLSKIRLGRENLLILPGYEPDITNSSLKDDTRESSR